MHLSIHNIKEVKITKTHQLKNSKSFTVDLIFIDEDEVRHELTLFSDNKEALKIQQLKSNHYSYGD